MKKSIRMDVIEPIKLPEHCKTCVAGTESKGAEIACGGWLVSNAIEILNASAAKLNVLGTTGKAIQIKLAGAAFAEQISVADVPTLQKTIEEGAQQCPGAVIDTQKSLYVVGQYDIVAKSVAFAETHLEFISSGTSHSGAEFGRGNYSLDLLRADSSNYPKHGISYPHAAEELATMNISRLVGVLSEAAQPRFNEAAKTLSQKVAIVLQSARQAGEY